jgi:hypothetical protein
MSAARLTNRQGSSTDRPEEKKDAHLELQGRDLEVRHESSAPAGRHICCHILAQLGVGAAIQLIDHLNARHIPMSSPLCESSIALPTQE